MRTRIATAALVVSVGLALSLATQAQALFIVMRHGKTPVAVESARTWEWPGGSLLLANHPLRMEQWHPMWGDSANDRQQFGYQIKHTADANGLTVTLGAVEGEPPVLELSPLREFKGFLEKDGSYQATFSVGSQKLANEWFANRDGRPARGKVLAAAPKIAPPTMTLYLGDRRVDVGSLQVPARVRVKSAVTPEQRENALLAPIIERIDALVKSRG
jgi:hypothetical protein